MTTLTRFIHQRKQKLLYLKMLLLSCFAILAFSPTIFAGTIKTDKADYPPGSIVNISGSGWQPGGAVILQVHHTEPDGDDDMSPAHLPWTVLADGNGNISSTWKVPFDEDELGAELRLTADGQGSSSHAEVLFTDNAGANLDQFGNGPAASPALSWQNGNLNANQSHYSEGYSVPYRLVITGLTLSTHTVTIEWDTKDNGKHGIDYITHYNNINDPLHLNAFGHAPEVIDPTLGVPGLGAPSTFPIPVPLSTGSPVAGQPTTSFNNLSALRLFTIYNGTITSVSAYSYTGTLTDASAQARITITFTASDPTVVIAWGGHIASETDWGLGQGATGISGSPYHTRLLDLDGSGGNQDRSLQAAAVVIPPRVDINGTNAGPLVACPETNQLIYTGSILNPNADPVTYTWSLLNNTAGAKISGSFSGTIAANISVVPSLTVVPIGSDFIPGGTFNVELKVTRDISSDYSYLGSDVSPGNNVVITNIILSATATPITIDLSSAAHNTTLGVDLSGSSDTDPSHYTYLWTKDPAAQGTLSCTTCQNPVYTASPSDASTNLTFTVTATQIAAPSCSKSATVAVSVTCTPSNHTTPASACDSYTWANTGLTYTSSGTYTGTTTNCVTEKLELTITTSSNHTTPASACDSYTWPNTGLTYTSSGTYTGTTTNCVTEKLELTITTSSNHTTPASACDSYTWPNTGLTYTSSGTYTGTTTNCVTEKLELTITTSSNHTTPASACDSYTWPNTGLTYTSSGTYTGTTTNCVTEKLELTITTSSNHTTPASACDSYTWPNTGLTYTSSGTYTGTTTNCVTEKLELTITTSSNHTTPASACDSYTWPNTGLTYTSSGTYTGTTTNCVTEKLELTITTSSNHTTPASACDSYTWPNTGLTYTSSGTYTGTTTNCVTEKLELTITTSSNHTTPASACDSYTWPNNGVTYTSSGTYTGTTTNCVTEKLELTITTSSNHTTPASACDSYTWPNTGLTYTSSGTYTGTTTNCVTEKLELTITTSSNHTTPASACDSYTWPNTGLTYTSSGTYTGTTTNCITEKLQLTITPSSSNTTTINACVTYTWPNNGQTYTVSGTYTGTTANCVTEKLSLTIVPLPSVSGIGGAFTKSCAVNVSGKTIGETPISGYTYSWTPTTGLSNPLIGNPIANPSVTTTYTVTKSSTTKPYCSATATVIVTVSPCSVYYTYTQGYYSSTGSSCTPAGGTKVGAMALIKYSLDNFDGIMNNSIGTLFLGKKISAGGTGSFTMNYGDDITKFISIMPGGGTAAKLAADYNIPIPSSSSLLKKGKINNVLLSQTITLSLNTHIPGNGLGSFILRDNYLTSMAGSGSSCPRTIAACSATTLMSLKITTNTTLMALLKGQNVNYLLSLASNALGGILPSGVNYTDINNAVDVINRSFDGGRFFIGYYLNAQTCSSLPNASPIVYSNIASRQAFVQSPESVKVTTLTVSTYPNPFTDRIKFRVVSPVSGKASIDIYNLAGQKLYSAYRGHVFAGSEQTIDVTLRSVSKGALIYTFRVGDSVVNGRMEKLK